MLIDQPGGPPLRRPPFFNLEVLTMWRQRALTEGERAAVAAILDSAGASSLLRTVAGMIEVRHPVQGCSSRYSRRLSRVAQDLDADQDAMQDGP
jgi:hypothetical protein